MPETITFSNGEREGDGRREVSVPIPELAEDFVADDEWGPLTEERFPTHTILCWIAHYETDGCQRWKPLSKAKNKTLQDAIYSLEPDEP